MDQKRSLFPPRMSLTELYHGVKETMSSWCIPLPPHKLLVLTHQQPTRDDLRTIGCNTKSITATVPPRRCPLLKQPCEAMSCQLIGDEKPDILKDSAYSYFLEEVLIQPIFKPRTVWYCR